MFTVFPRILNESAELVSVECQATGDPPPLVSWLTGDNQIISNNTNDVRPSLSLHSLPHHHHLPSLHILPHSLPPSSHHSLHLSLISSALTLPPSVPHSLTSSHTHYFVPSLPPFLPLPPSPTLPHLLSLPPSLSLTHSVSTRRMVCCTSHLRSQMTVDSIYVEQRMQLESIRSQSLCGWPRKTPAMTVSVCDAHSMFHFSSYTHTHTHTHSHTHSHKT